MLRVSALAPLIVLLLLAVVAPAMLPPGEFDSLRLHEVQENEALWGSQYAGAISSTAAAIVHVFTTDAAPKNVPSVNMLSLPGDGGAVLARNLGASLGRLSQSDYILAIGSQWRLVAYRIATAAWILFPAAFIMLCATGVDAAVRRRIRGRTFRSARPEVVTACLATIAVSVGAGLIYPFVPMYVSPLAILGFAVLGLLGVHGALANYHHSP